MKSPLALWREWRARCLRRRCAEIAARSAGREQDTLLLSIRLFHFIESGKVPHNYRGWYVEPMRSE